ncbi:MAG: NADH-quinone oxidoreductase subunit J [Candidatus Latescibacteria bacterium]|jgi:NADH:ubiquinone oxidoreductase subunit 6 (subunit J)|nr:NADH-quinone oxidoreductase subunit J [Candidatus Latescibacterota bacterium]MBT4137580.1 NADH-quinone oxidoreductase subunit J [Candidatus Latescibacterota bacterium]
MPDIIVYIFVVLTLIGGIVAAVARQVLYNIIGLGISLLGLAGLFLNLGSPFVAAMQVLIYIGGITVAIVFAMMLSIAMSLLPPTPNMAKRVFAILSGIVFFVALASMIMGTHFNSVEPAAQAAWSVGQIGHALLTTYNLVFETLSLVLLLAIIGAILIARKDTSTP